MLWPNNADKASKPAILVANKLDLTPGEVATNSVPARCLQRFDDTVSISATTGTNLVALQNALESAALAGTGNEGRGHAWTVNERQAAVLIGARQSLLHLQGSIQAGLPLDFWTIDLRAAVDMLGEVTGDVVTEEILDKVFSKFCIGK
jgi:tRNA modification GTPase